MRLKEWVDVERGRQSVLARAIDAQAQLVWQWANDVRPVPIERRPAVERATDGAVTCEEMSIGDADWLRVKDRDWPWHPKGRPVLELAKVVS